MARSAGDRWNEGYALGTMASAAAGAATCARPSGSARRRWPIMRAIEQLWGSARALLGPRRPGQAARGGRQSRGTTTWRRSPSCARSTPGRRSRAAWRASAGSRSTSPTCAAARQHLTESLRLSFASGSRIGIARGLEALARLAVLERNPQLAVQLAGAISTLRAEAHLPPMPGARTQRFLDAAAGLGEHAVTRLWQDGTAMTPAAAVRLALGEAVDDGPAAGTAAVREPAQDTPAGGLTPREHEVVALLGRRPEQPRHRQEAVHQPGDRRPARRQHPGQAGLQLAQPGRRLGERRPCQAARRPRPDQPARTGSASAEQRAD